VRFRLFFLSGSPYMDVKSAIITLASGPWPALDEQTLKALISTYFVAFSPYPGIDGKRLIYALAMNESSGGKNCNPRHEMGYCTGVYSKNPIIINLTAKFGHMAHCSYGPWQIMLDNCPPGYTPDQMRDPAECARGTAAYVIKSNQAHRPKSVAEWGQFWNGGHVGASNPDVNAYVVQLQKYYDNALI
jgi:hypothetical protein